MNAARRVVYPIVRALVIAVCRVMFAMTIDGSENVPLHGPFVLAPVHRSNIDFALVAAVTRRRMRIMAKASLWKVRVLGAWVELLGAFPVKRGTADREALRLTEACIQRGEPVIMFPEGARKSGPVLEPLFEGVAFVAARNGVPIIPVGIGGSERAMPKGAKWIRPVRIHLTVGKAIDPGWDPKEGRPPRRVVRELSARLREELQQVFDDANERVGIHRQPSVASEETR